MMKFTAEELAAAHVTGSGTEGDPYICRDWTGIKFFMCQTSHKTETGEIIEKDSTNYSPLQTYIEMTTDPTIPHIIDMNDIAPEGIPRFTFWNHMQFDFKNWTIKNCFMEEQSSIFWFGSYITKQRDYSSGPSTIKIGSESQKILIKNLNLLNLYFKHSTACYFLDKSTSTGGGNPYHDFVCMNCRFSFIVDTRNYYYIWSHFQPTNGFYQHSFINCSFNMKSFNPVGNSIFGGLGPSASLGYFAAGIKTPNGQTSSSPSTIYNFDLFKYCNFKFNIPDWLRVTIYDGYIHPGTYNYSHCLFLGCFKDCKISGKIKTPIKSYYERDYDISNDRQDFYLAACPGSTIVVLDFNIKCSTTDYTPYVVNIPANSFVGSYPTEYHSTRYTDISFFTSGNGTNLTKCIVNIDHMDNYRTFKYENNQVVEDTTKRYLRTDLNPSNNIYICHSEDLVDADYLEDIGMPLMTEEILNY